MKGRIIIDFQELENCLLEVGFKPSTDKQNYSAGWYEMGSNSININILASIIFNIKNSESNE